MVIKRFLRKWPYLSALLGLAVLSAAILAVTAIQGGLGQVVSGAMVEVVTDHPLHAEHRMPAETINRTVPGGGARVEIPVDFYDFGAVGSQSVVRRDFLVINRGSGPLVIQQAYTTCGCTTAELTASVIPPGKASRVTLIFDAGFHPVAGETVRRGLVLETNDPERPEAEIWVQASVK